MNREIKFRGLRIDGKGWVYGYFVKDPQGQCRIYWQPFKEATNHTYHFVKPETVGQFTGLSALKRKGYLEKEVWELDVFREQKETNVGDEVEYLIVMWIKQRAAFYLIPASHYHVISNSDVSKEKEFEWLFSDAALYDFSIDIGLTKVGNIIDNPELLTK